MPAVITVQGVAKSFGSRQVLSDVSFAVDELDRIALVGVNGSGKSTLLHLIAAARVSTDPNDALDAGIITKRRDLTLEYVAQEPRLEAAHTVEQALRFGLRQHAEATARLAAVDHQMAGLAGEALDRAIYEQADLHHRIATLGGFDLDHEVHALAAALGLRRLDQLIGELSIGERRRVALGCALLAQPDVLALDEPTNHLDARTVEWLEGRLLAHRGALLLVTHDRYFLDRVATRILEIDRGRLYPYEGGYSRFLEKQADRLDAQSERERVRRAFVRRELDWIRRGPQARTTKQQARIDRFDAAVAAGAGTQEPNPAERTLGLRLPRGPRLGKTILELRHLSKSLGSRALFQDLSLLVKAGDRIGVVGLNGAGKTTLVRTVLGLTQPDEGEVIVGVNTRFAFLDQARAELDDNRSVLAEVAGDNDQVFLEDGPIHVRSFLRLLLFDDTFADMRVGQLSGGERNRVQLAKLLRQGGNFLVLDEPTNDLDLMTLGVLEAALAEFPGCALVVSHDRWFLDRVATGILAFEGEGRVTFYEGNYTSYLEKCAAAQAGRGASTSASASTKASAGATGTTRPAAPGSGARVRSSASVTSPSPERAKKLSYRDQRELDAIEGAIETAEGRAAELEAKLSSPDLYATGGTDVPRLVQDLDGARAEVERLYARWQELESWRAPEG